MSLKPWRELITPHKDVLEGTFQESEFAADITKVAKGTASPEYQDPILFFERTYITEGMRLLLDSVVKRINGSGGDPVVQLKTAFGGGKTHAILSVYHLVKGEKPISELAGVNTILDKSGVSDVPKAHVAVLDGIALSPSQPRTYGKVKVNTLWGELAWQLGGKEGYSMVEKSDQDGTSPDKVILAKLFEKYSPAVVLMDETVAYVRQFEKRKTYAGGTFDSNMFFLQALTEAASHVPTACILASLPESDMEAGGERGKEALKAIEHLFHRLEAIWKPIATEEGFEIVRRRLFSKMTDESKRDKICKAFADYYIEGDCYPAETKKSSYLDRLKTSYPFHPEVFDRLYEDWATLENFQRTRGVLRLMAMVVHRLWSDGNQDLMIMPGSLPLYDTVISNELLRYLPQGWEPVLERDVDGKRSAPTEIDEKNPLLGSVQAGRRVTRSIFLGSAPASSGQKIRGINAEHIRLGCCQPEQQPGRFDDALKRLNDQLYHLYSSNERYWFDTQTNLRREAEDRMNRFQLDEHLMPEIAKRLKNVLKGKLFAGIHIFTPHEDIPDDSNIRLVVLPPRQSHQWHKEDSQAIQSANEVQSKRGLQPRLNQNRLIYLAADADATSTVYDQTKRFLSWQSIVADRDALNLDQHRLKEANKNQKESDDRLNGAIREVYKWVLAPFQEPDKNGGVGEIKWEEQRINPSDVDLTDSIINTLQSQEIIIPQWAPPHLVDVLNKWYWKDEKVDVQLQNVWNDCCRYTYLPRLVDSDVLQNTVADGIQSKDFFAYASDKDGDKYQGLKFNSSGTVYIDDQSLLIKPAAAIKQLDSESSPVPVGPLDKDVTTPEGIIKNAKKVDTLEGAVELVKRFYGTAQLNPTTASLDFAKIMEEVVQHFSAQMGTDVKINLEIEAKSNKGFDETIQRTVKENSNALGFNQAEFEEE